MFFDFFFSGLMCESEVTLFVFVFLLSHKHTTIIGWPGNTLRFLCSNLLNILIFTEKVIQRPLEQGSCFSILLHGEISS